MLTQESKFLTVNFANSLEESFKNGPLGYSDIIDKIKKFDIPLNIDLEGLCKDDESLAYKTIQQYFHYVKAVFAKPKSFIETIEDKRPIETAPRISKRAITKLGMDSSDWHSRTVLSVKPKRILAQVSEETYDIYENRFACLLLRKVERRLSAALDKIDAYLKTIVWADMTDRFSTKKVSYSGSNPNSTLIYDEMYGNAYIDIPTTRSDAENKKAEIVKLLTETKRLKQTELYKLIGRKKPPRLPIQKTNILTFDKYYKNAYELWIKLLKNTEEEIDEKIHNHDIDVSPIYGNYCLLSVLSSIYSLGLTSLNNEKIMNLDNGRIVLNGALRFESSYTTVAEKKERYKSYLIVSSHEHGLLLKTAFEAEDYEKGDWKLAYRRWNEKEMLIAPDPDFATYSDFDGKSNEEAESLFEELLNRKTGVPHTIYMLCSNLKSFSSRNNYSEKLYRRLNSIGENFSPEESSENIKKWGNYQKGAIVVSPLDFFSVLLRIQRMINKFILPTDSILGLIPQTKGRRGYMFDSLETCPLCGSEGKMTKLNESGSSHDLFCPQCNNILSIQSCKTCNDGKRYLCVRPNLTTEDYDEFSKVSDLENKQYYERVEIYQAVVGKFSTLSNILECDQPGKWKLRIICPTCGNKFGQ